MRSTPIAKMVREMIARGVDPDVIELAVATAEQSAGHGNSGGIPVDHSAEKRRAYDRERKRISAELRRNSTGTPQNSENASLSTKNSNLEKKESKREAQRGNRLSDDWVPDATDWQAALDALGAERAKAELAKFRDHWKQQPGSKGVKLDWSAAWRNWIRRSAEYHGGSNGTRNLNPQRRSASDNFFAGMSSLAADIAGHDQSSGPSDPEIPLGRFNIDG